MQSGHLEKTFGVKCHTCLAPSFQHYSPLFTRSDSVICSVKMRTVCRLQMQNMQGMAVAREIKVVERKMKIFHK